MRGRPRKPTAQKALTGTLRKHRTPKNEPKPAVEEPTCPAWLDAEAKREWRRVVPYLLRIGLLSQIDRSALAAYCQNFARWYRAEKLLEEHGLVMITPQGFEMQRPEVGIANGAMKQMHKFMVEFGMTPAARSRINVGTGEEKGEDPWDELARRRASRSA